jgi:UrcA family protein
MSNFAKYLTAAALGAAVLSQPLLAAEETGKSVEVAYADLNLATEKGRAELDNRLEAAAREACSMDEKIVGSRITSRESRLCYQETREQLDQQFAAIVKKSQAGG